MRLIARLYIAFVCLVGMTLLTSHAIDWQSHNVAQFLCYLAIAVLSSGLKVKVPGVMGTMSVNFLFILIGITDMSLVETVIIGCVGTFVQCIWKPKSTLRAIQVCFSVSNTAISACLAYRLYHLFAVEGSYGSSALLLMVTALVFFILNTGGIAIVISLTGGSSLSKTWHDCYFWT